MSVLKRYKLCALFIVIHALIYRRWSFILNGQQGIQPALALAVSWYVSLKRVLPHGQLASRVIWIRGTQKQGVVYGQLGHWPA